MSGSHRPRLWWVLRDLFRVEPSRAPLDCPWCADAPQQHDMCTGVAVRGQREFVPAVVVACACAGRGHRGRIWARSASARSG